MSILDPRTQDVHLVVIGEAAEDVQIVAVIVGDAERAEAYRSTYQEMTGTRTRIDVHRSTRDEGPERWLDLTTSIYPNQVQPNEMDVRIGDTHPHYHVHTTGLCDHSRHRIVPEKSRWGNGFSRITVTSSAGPADQAELAQWHTARVIEAAQEMRARMNGS